MIVLTQCDLPSAEVNVATNAWNNFFSPTYFKKQNEKIKNIYTLYNKFCAEKMFINKIHLNLFNRILRVLPEKQNDNKNITNITKNVINVRTLSYVPTRPSIDTERVISQDELRPSNYVNKGKTPLFFKLIKKNMNQVLRKVPLSHSLEIYMTQRPYVVSRPSSIQLMKPTTTHIMTQLFAQYTVASTINTPIEVNTKRIELTKQNISIKQLRKILRVKSAIPLGIRLVSKSYVVTREVTQKESNIMLPVSLKTFRKQKGLKRPYKEVRTKTKVMYEATSQMPLDNNFSRWILPNEKTTKGSPVNVIYMYLPSETTTNKIFNLIPAFNKTECEDTLFKKMTMDLMTTSPDFEASSF